MDIAKIALIGGSGLYNIDELKNIQEYDINTAFGKCSAPIICGELNGVKLAFLARHGRNHSLLPSEVPYRANILALKSLGVKYILSFSAVGSLKEEIKPRDMVIPNQYLDFTKNRASTFFGEGAIAHVSMAEPTCPNLNQLLIKAIESCLPSSDIHRQGTYVCMEGPQFSSLAESNFYRLLGADLIGMTNMPEAKLAKEAQIAYSSLCMVTDYDCWHPKEGAVTAEMAIANLKHNLGNAKKVLSKILTLFQENMPKSSFHNALDHALITPFDFIPEDTRKIVEILLRKR